MNSTSVLNRFIKKVFRSLTIYFCVLFVISIIEPLRTQNTLPLSFFFLNATAQNMKFGVTSGALLTASGKIPIDIPVMGSLNNDTDTEDSTITNLKVTDLANDALILNNNGSVTNVHNNGASTPDGFNYKVNDGMVDGNTAPVSITVTYANTPPIIADISKAGTMNVPILFTGADFANKFIDLNGDVLVKVKIVTLPSNGNLKLDGADIVSGREILLADLPKITFVPPVEFIGGPISFLWNGSDGTDYALVSKSVNITIGEPNVPPVAVADAYSTTKGSTLNVAVPGVLTNDSDANGNPITAIKVSDPSSGTLTLNANGSFTYINNNGASTSDSFNYKVNDGIAEGNTVTVSITVVNTPPQVSNISKTSMEYLPILFQISDFVNKYTDPNGDPHVKVRIITLPLNGILKLYGTPLALNQEIPVAELAGLTFEPAFNWSGTTNFTWNGSDGISYAAANANAAITVIVATDPNAKIGLAKNLASVIPALNGTYDVKFVFTVVNYGPNSLEKISINDNLALAFVGTEVKIKTVAAYGNLNANTSFNGWGDIELLLPTSRLIAGEEAKVELLINVKLMLGSGVFQNSAIAEAASSVNGFQVIDVSTNGLKPDPNSTGDVSLSESTLIKLDRMPTYIPEGFSPNGDGMNDKFVVQNVNDKHVSLEMYNRWGNRVYRSDDYKNDWGGEVTEGFFLGRDIPDGTCYYIIIIDRKDKYAGFITVNR